MAPSLVSETKAGPVADHYTSRNTPDPAIEVIQRFVKERDGDVSERPDLIVMDLALPKLDGWEATRRLKGQPETKGIPIIALSAHAMAGDRERALVAGCDDFESKPIDFPGLVTKIHAVLDRRTPQQ